MRVQGRIPGQTDVHGHHSFHWAVFDAWKKTWVGRCQQAYDFGVVIMMRGGLRMARACVEAELVMKDSLWETRKRCVEELRGWQAFVGVVEAEDVPEVS